MDPLVFLLYCVICGSGLLFLYKRHFEIFIVLILFVNQEAFFLFRKSTGVYISDLLFIIMVLFFIPNLYTRGEKFLHFRSEVYILVGIVIFGAFLPYYTADQPMALGLKAARNYFLILFYFVFCSKFINIRKFAFWIVIVGVSLSALNNIQYFWRGLHIFYYEIENELTRSGKLRFLIGDFFTIFAPLVALGSYLLTKKIAYGFAAMYMVITVAIQGQTRAVIAGFSITIVAILFLYKYLNPRRLFLISVIFVGLFLKPEIVIENPFFTSLFNLTREEVLTGDGNWGIRLVGYKYFSNQIAESPFFGKGIWNDLFVTVNPENMKHKKLYLSDLGLMSLFFHFGSLGLLWLILVLKKIFIRIRLLGIQNLQPIVPAYFIFGLTTCATLNCFTNSRTIIYFALVLALLDQEWRRLRNTPVTSATLPPNLESTT